MDKPLSTYTLNKKVFSVTSMDEAQNDKAFWLSKTPQERWEAIEFLRRISYGTRATGRLQRVLTVTQL